ncbi:potassium channel family protein [Paenibacillus shunpengii]|uniref:Potassium channel family protein n=1 Tax=Paenibacillus shunpengii TaxID=2054424 RepID=A0ABW5ST12_9BACL|nr:potassium channel family protein [Paenibacillus sp. PDC88]SDW52831.1 Ion channel [Paenibacillus sp. PDC88]
MISFILTLKRLLQGIYHGFKDKKFLALFVVMLATLLSGTIFYSSVEGWNWIDALYFSAVTLTTVGHPELSPQTTFAKIFTVIYMFAGIGITFGMIARITLGIIVPDRLSAKPKETVPVESPDDK